MKALRYAVIDKDGKEVSRGRMNNRLRADAKKKGCTVVLLSGRDTPKKEQAGGEAPKPAAS